MKGGGPERTHNAERAHMVTITNTKDSFLLVMNSFSFLGVGCPCFCENIQNILQSKSLTAVDQGCQWAGDGVSRPTTSPCTLRTGVRIRILGLI